VAIENIHRHFLDIIRADQRSTDELANIFAHKLEFPKSECIDVIYNSTVKSLKSVGIFSTNRVNKKDPSKTVKMSAFELSKEDAADYKKTLEDLALFAYNKVFTAKNIKKTYKKYFGNDISVDSEGTISFPQGVYGRPTKAGGDRRKRHDAQKDLAVQGVKVVLKNFIPEFKETVKNKGKFYVGRHGSMQNEAKVKRFKKLKKKDKIKTRAVDSHSTMGNDTTTALLNALLNLETAVDQKIAPIVSQIVDKDNIITTTRNEMLKIFSEFKIGNQKITDIVAQRAKGTEVKDLITVTLEYGTDKLNRSNSKKDRDRISKRLDEIAQNQLEKLANTNLNKTNKRYRDLKGSKTFGERLEDGALNNTISMVEGVERISKLLKGVKVTSGTKVKAKKKQTSEKTSKGSVYNRKRSTKNTKKAKGVGVRERIAATGIYNPRTTASDIALGNLMNMIQKALPRHLKNNMEPPALQYRGIGNPKQGTGPFNTGVRITSVKNNKKVPGGINVNYTYEKYPYQTFEPGFKQGDPFRDPRKLIQESIRDIMIERKQSRFLNFRRY
jgi:hypothetical protein